MVVVYSYGKTYNVEKLAENYWRTAGGRAYIREEDGFFIVYAANGDRKGIRRTFEDAVVKAYEV